ncbi:glycosyltransferase family 4 protein [Bosea sp. BK604]|uniref:glycosyltransferase family 4 protein n=1 Tax=Bosea sp. BK604 TaxID=2512180 RepID=UPI00104A636B|nr:glycosyltransferase family 4 protein [Bosea sp. BK604]TCR62607.1 glycosyltransferase involved in cell wall biosynthesis [Bosea sp. BK604]
MIRVLAAIVAPPHLSVSGAGRAAEQLSLGLAQHCDVTIASMMGSQTAPEESKLRRAAVKVTLPFGLPWQRIPNRYRTLFYRSDIPELIRAGGFDLVHLHNPMPALEMARIARACRQAGIPYVVSTHGFNEIANGDRIYGFGLLKQLVWKSLVTLPVRSALRHAAAIFALSPADKEISRKLGFAGDAFALVPNGVPASRPADPAGDEAIYARLGLGERKPGRITCMFLANHTPNKGLPILLSAFSQLDCPYQLIVGGEKRPEVDYGLASPRRPDQQIVVTGRLSDDEVAALFRRSDLFVFPTLADTFPLAILEAMSYGLPVLASHVGGIPYQIDDRCGRLVEAGNVEQLAEAVSRFARAPATLAKMGRHARARVATQFTWDSAASRAFAEYERLLSSPHIKPAPAKPRVGAATRIERGTPA